MTVQELLNKVHLRYERNTDYPDSSSEDFLIRLGYFDDATTEWEKYAREGVAYPFLKKSASFSAGGAGSDDLSVAVPDFLSFIRNNAEGVATLYVGTSGYSEVSLSDGNRCIQNGVTPYVFWMEGSVLRTLPASGGTITFPYLKKANRYSTGLETTPIEFPDEKFYQEYILAMLYLDDGNLNQYQAHVNKANDFLSAVKSSVLAEPIADNWFGLGM